MQLATRLSLTCLLALAACSSNKNGNGTDGGNGDGGSGSIDAPGAACDYTEADDGSNNTTAEATGVTIGTQNQTICGQVNNGHFGSASMTVDVDMYTVTVGSSTAELIVRFENMSPSSLTDFQVTITDTSVDPTLLNSGDYNGTLGDHGAYLAELPTGTYNVVVTATAAADIAAAIPYKVELVADQPTTRCPDLTGMTADYTEANDGAANNGNDVVLVDFAKIPSFSLTPSTTDAPEMTGLTVDSSKNWHVVGSSAAVAAGTDTYLDRDTYAITTGASINELSIRLNWPGSTADLDYLVFEANNLTTPNVAATLTATTEDEFATFAVKPSSSYWVWIGAYEGSTGQPIAYSASVCAATFTP
jgi:hypothetical protein